MIVLGGISGVFGGLGVLVLLQQFAVLYPTRVATIVAVVLGAVIGMAGPLLAGRSGAASAPAAAAAQPVYETVSAPAPATTVQLVPASGLQAWDEPDPSLPATRDLAAGSSVQVIEQRGEWANVETDDGWRGWVDARLLEMPGS